MPALSCSLLVFLVAGSLTIGKQEFNISACFPLLEVFWLPKEPNRGGNSIPLHKCTWRKQPLGPTVTMQAVERYRNRSTGDFRSSSTAQLLKLCAQAYGYLLKDYRQAGPVNYEQSYETGNTGVYYRHPRSNSDWFFNTSGSQCNERITDIKKDLSSWSTCKDNPQKLRVWEVGWKA